MSATYHFVPIPLDAAQAGAAPFCMHLLSTIEFAPGLRSASDIANAVANHPLFSGGGNTLRGLTMSFADWNRTKKIVAGAPGVSGVTLAYRSTEPLNSKQDALKDFLARPSGAPVAALSPDRAVEKRRFEDFLDIAGFHDRIVTLRALLQQGLAARAGLRASSSLSELSDRSIGYSRTRWMAGHAQVGLIELLFGAVQAKDIGLDDEGAKILAKARTEIGQLRRRLDAKGPEAHSNGLLASAESGDTEIDPRDPNAAMHAALTNGLIAEACGLVTKWTVQSATPLAGDLVIAVDSASFPGAPTLCKATAFRRQRTTHPLSFRDIGQSATSNGALATLNDPKGAPRYSCTGVNAEMAVLQATLLQAENSVVNAPSAMPTLLGDDERRRDDRPAVELSDQQFGVNELETAGLTISAPAADLVVPDALKAETRERDLPCLFLEDLWVGYRLDIAAEGGGKLRSVHRQNQRVRFEAGRTIGGVTEDFWPREAPNADARQLSTEIIRFNGLSATQNNDYSKFLGTYEEPPAAKGAPFRVETEGCAGVTPLTFRRSYDYRLRNVFQGGVSLTEDDPDLPALGAQFVQRAAFLRARSFRPGELVAVGDTRRPGEKTMSVFLTETDTRRRILVAPSPVDPDTARYGGQFLSSADEGVWDAKRAFVSDLSAYLGAEGEEAPYYCDPDVAAISVEVWMRNGDPQSTDREFGFEDGVFCEMVEPLHLGPVTARFGNAGQWREFRPVEILLTKTTSLRPVLKVEAGGRRVRVEVPVAADIELVLTPVVPIDAVLGSASFASSTSVAQLAGPSLQTAAGGLPVVEHRIRVVHCTRAPVAVPVVVSERNAGGTDAVPLAILRRDPSSDRAELSGYVQLDAASTGELQIEGAWNEIDDDPLHDRYLLKPGRSLSRPRSIQFRQYAPPSPAATLKAFVQGGAAAAALVDVESRIGRQCAENRVFMGGFKPAGLSVEGEVAPCVLALGSSRRARLGLVAVAKGRYADLHTSNAKRPTSRSSRPVEAEAPASMVLPSPIISHVMPLARQIDAEDRGRRTRRRIYAFRVYVRRPWFVSGHGERLAIGCHVGVPPTGPSDTLNRAHSQWGEDPLARARTNASRRLPRAADFRAAGRPALDPSLYPPGSPEGRDPVLYLDDVVRDAEAATDGDGRLSLASYALQWDDAQKLWYCDIELADDFNGWLGLALYRHQPQAHEGTQLSRTSTWVYSLVLRGERVTWVRQNRVLSVTIGPVSDRTLDFEAEERRYAGGVSGLPGGETTKRLPFRRYEVDGKFYFEGRFTTVGDGIEIVRRRLGNDISSFRLETKA